MLTREEADAIGREHEARMKMRMPIRAKVANASARVIADTFKTGPVPSDGSTLEVTDRLTAAALRRLMTNETCALRVRGFVASETCDVLATWMLETCRFQKWENGAVDQTDMYHGVGIPVNALAESRERCIAYFAEAVPAIQRVREAAGSRMGPVDRLRLELDELWPEGANLRVDPVYRKKMFAGLGRLMTPDGMIGSDALKTRGIIHNDAPIRLSPEAGLFSANAYLRVPESGGELDVWSVSPNGTSALVLAHWLAQSFDPEPREETQRLLRQVLPVPKTVTVETGDLVVLNAGRPHAVRGFPEGRRVTLQTFIEHRGGQPLSLFA